MKKLFKTGALILSVLFLSFGFQFCENSLTEDSQVEDFVNPYEIVGEIHNQGLEYVLEKTREIKRPTFEIQDIIDLTTKFLVSNEKINFEIKDPSKFKDLELVIMDQLKGKKKSIDSTKIFLKGTRSNNYYNRICKIYDRINFEDTVSSFKAINRLENEIWNSKVSDREKAELLVMSSVGRHSFSFWKKNLPELIDTKSTNDEDWRQGAIALLKADMEGGLCGFIGGAIVGAIGGTLIMPGVGTLTAAILEGVQAGVWGAIITSAYTFVVNYVIPSVCEIDVEQSYTNRVPLGMNISIRSKNFIS